MPIVRFPFYHYVALKGGLRSSLSTLAMALPPPLHSHWLQQEGEEANPGDIQRTFWSFMLSTAFRAFGWRIISAWRSVFCLTLFQDCPHPTLVQHILALIPWCVSCLELPWWRNYKLSARTNARCLILAEARCEIRAWLLATHPRSSVGLCAWGGNILFSLVQFITFLACRILRRLMWRLKWYSGNMENQAL